MATVNKIDSNVTGLRYTEEQSYGVLPATPEWVPLEPNSYAEFGGSITTLSRTPISDTRQRKKGVTVDLDASGGFNTDLTQYNLRDLLQGYLFASTRDKSNAATEVERSAASHHRYYLADTSGFHVGSLIQTRGFTAPENNKTLVRITEVVENMYVGVGNSEAVVDEDSPPVNAQVILVGHEFNLGTVDVGEAGANAHARYAFDPMVAATATETVTTNPSDDDTLTVGSVTYTFQDSAGDVSNLTGTAQDVLIGSAIADTVDNIIDAINGVDAGREAHPQVSAEDLSLIHISEPTRPY